MNIHEFFRALQVASGVEEVERSLSAFGTSYPNDMKWVPFGNRENNRGAIDSSADPGRSLVERVTNAIDAILESEYQVHHGTPDCRSPKEAASAWLNVPVEGLSNLDVAQRRRLAQRTQLKLSAGGGKDARTVEVRDNGIGITPEQMPNTILSLNEGNKLKKHYVAGVYGQGGSSTFAVSKYTLIASRFNGSPIVGFTIVRYLDLPPDEYKTGHYVYLTLNGLVLQVEIDQNEFETGTQVKHFGYDLSSYPSPLGPNSIYGLLNCILFDPILPIWLDNGILDYRRVIKGSRNALNGAVDDEDENRRGPTLSHHIPMFYAGLGDFGRVGIEYWVLERPHDENRSKPSAAFVNPSKPIILTLNGQSHAELSRQLIKKDAELTYLSSRLIGHIDCNSLSPAAKRAFFVSNREDVRRGAIYDLIQQEFVKALKSDDNLTGLNNEARAQNMQTRDEAAVQQMRNEVARILRVQGFDVVDSIGAVARGGDETSDGLASPRGRQPVQPIELHDPPTYIKLLWDEEKPISFYSEQRRYLRIQTDANSSYHNPNDPSSSKINIIVLGEGVSCRGSTSLHEGRMRAIFEGNAQSAIGSSGTIRIELMRQGLPTLSDERIFTIVEKPPVHPTGRQLSLPPFEVIPVSPGDEMWNNLEWPAEPSDIASSAFTDQGILKIYYSTVYPKYADKKAAIEQRNSSLVNSFVKRYEVWLAVHSLLLNQEHGSEIPNQGAQQQQEDSSTSAEEYERKERCRVATLSALFASQEIRTQDLNQEEDQEN